MTQHIVLGTVTVAGDQVTVAGTVDGVAVTVQVWKSHLDTLATNPQKRDYIAAQLKAAAPAARTIIAALQGLSVDI